jgi:hypothetical protein
MKIQLYIDVPNLDSLSLNLTFNNNQVLEKISTTKNKFGHYCWEFDVDAKPSNIIKLSVSGIVETNYINIADCIIDDINYDVVHLMNCQANGIRGATQLDIDGYIEIPFTTPVCLHWAKVFNNFTYEDYPHWIN